jgi:hypothetical protein
MVIGLLTRSGPANAHATGRFERLKGVRNQEMRCLLRSSVKLSRKAGTPVEPLAAL